jgi:hypothetical protein
MYQTTQCSTPEDSHLHIRRRDNMIPHTVKFSTNSTYLFKTDVGMISPSSPTFPSFLSNSEKKVIIIITFGTTALYVP